MTIGLVMDGGDLGKISIIWAMLCAMHAHVSIAQSVLGRIFSWIARLEPRRSRIPMRTSGPRRRKRRNLRYGIGRVPEWFLGQSFGEISVASV
ncbi:hypothetical protein VK792_12310 [Mesobacterium sp. TK19101]|uniref:Uncharacterized protein n=1 Tax=Mesobacterium hydrothermale TaxID=3111907 RepID=A0ABU6HLL9_9RHOB|nr:hypothetical protein [Mesobacterium sp. TK19101]MEC3862070.1 hypothetical protein [Mesobacterium sp. TK19101]